MHVCVRVCGVCVVCVCVCVCGGCGVCGCVWCMCVCVCVVCGVCVCVCREGRHVDVLDHAQVCGSHRPVSSSIILHPSFPDRISH